MFYFNLFIWFFTTFLLIYLLYLLIFNQAKRQIILQRILRQRSLLLIIVEIFSFIITLFTYVELSSEMFNNSLLKELKESTYKSTKILPLLVFWLFLPIFTYIIIKFGKKTTSKLPKNKLGWLVVVVNSITITAYIVASIWYFLYG